MHRGVIRSHAKAVTELPRNGSGGCEVKKDGRQDVDPNVVKLTQVLTPHEGGAIMGYLDKVMKETLPERSKGFMESRDRGIRQEIIEPNGIMSKIEIAAYNRSNSKGVRYAPVHALEIVITLERVPSGGVMNTYKKEINVRRDEHHTNDPPLDNTSREAQQAGREERSTNANGHAPTISVIGKAPEAHMGVLPLTGEGITFKPISMQLAKSNNVITCENPSSTSGLQTMNLGIVKCVGSKEAMSVPCSAMQ